MNRAKVIDRIFDDIVTLGAIAALVYIASLGVGDSTLLIGAISGLGGYRIMKRNGKSGSD